MQVTQSEALMFLNEMIIALGTSWVKKLGEKRLGTRKGNAFIAHGKMLGEKFIQLKYYTSSTTSLIIIFLYEEKIKVIWKANNHLGYQDSHGAHVFI
jgi:hypothetical protein